MSEGSWAAIYCCHVQGLLQSDQSWLFTGEMTKLR
jgi:hypothetical protein